MKYVILWPDEGVYYVCTVGRRNIDVGTDNFSRDVEDAASWNDKNSAAAMMKFLNLDEDGCIVKEV